MRMHLCVLRRDASRRDSSDRETSMTLYILTRHSRPSAGLGRWSYRSCHLPFLTRLIPMASPSAFRRWRYIGRVMPSESAERRRERQRNFLYHYQRTTARSLLAKLEALRLGQVGLHEKRRVYTATSTWLSSDLAIVFGYY